MPGMGRVGHSGHGFLILSFTRKKMREDSEIPSTMPNYAHSVRQAGWTEPSVRGHRATLGTIATAHRPGAGVGMPRWSDCGL